MSLVFARRFVALAAALLALQARAEIAVGENVNMVTGRTMPGGDPYLQRQNEPSLAVSSLNPNHLLACANDYRTVDVPFATLAPPKAMGDAWGGVFKSHDGGRTWRSAPLPGFPQDTSNEGARSPLRECATTAEGTRVGCVAAADPVVRAGTDGLFYYAGLAFTRDMKSSKIFVARFLDGNDKEDGTSAETDPIRYVDTKIVASGSATVFVDKPWIAVDVPRGWGACTLNGKPAGAVYVVYTAFQLGADGREVSSDVMFTQSLDCAESWSPPVKISTRNSSLNQGATIAVEPITGRLVVAWRRIASGAQSHAIMASRSHGRKRQFSNPRVVARIVPFDQSGLYSRVRTQTMPSLAISSNGTSSWAHVAWSQRTVDPANPLPAELADARIVVSSAAIHPPPAGDQDTDESEEIETETRVKWSAPQLVEPAPVLDDVDPPRAYARGHQFMPSLAFGEGRLLAIYYDSRLDHTRGRFTPSVLADGSFALTPEGSFFWEGREPVGGLESDPGVFLAPGTPESPGFAYLDDWAVIQRVLAAPEQTDFRRTVDVRAAIAGVGGAPVFRSFPLSKMSMGVSPDGALQQYGWNPPALPMYRQGTLSFFGDYIDATVRAHRQLPSGEWVANYAPSAAPVFHAIWTSNQNVRPPPDGDWTKFTPVKLDGQSTSFFDPAETPTFCSGTEGGYEGTRNQDIYTARITDGLVVASPQNAKPLSATSTRGFVIAAQNTTPRDRRFRFSFSGVPTGVSASFDEEASLASVEVAIAAHSTVSRTAFARLFSSAVPATSSVTVDVTELDCGTECLAGSVTLNPPGTVSTLVQPDSGSSLQDVNLGDLWAAATTSAVLVDGNANPTVLNPTVLNPTVLNPTVLNPTVLNPTVLNPTVLNPTVLNPTVLNPTVLNPTVLNPTVLNPTVLNPTVLNPTVLNPTVLNATVSDLSYELTNTGNTATSFRVQVVSTGGGNVAVPRPLQAIVTKFYLTPSAYGCQRVELSHGLTETTIPDVSGAVVTDLGALAIPDVADGSATHVTVFLAPGEKKTFTLRAFVPLAEMALVGSNVAIAVVPDAGLPGNPTYGDVVVVGQPTATTLSWDAASADFTASVTPADATGVVTFIRDGAAAGAVPLDASGVARFRYDPVVGQRMVAYYAGDATHRSSVSDAYVHGGIATTTTLTSTPGTWTAGAPVLLQAQVTADLVTDLTALLAAGRVQPLVEFVVDGVVTTATFEPRPDALIATHTTTFGPGDHAVSARFVGFGTGADRFLPSVSNTLSQAIAAAAPIRVRSYYVSGEVQRIGVEQGGLPVTDAIVEVNGTTLPYVPAISAYRGSVPVPAGGAITAQVSARGATVTATGTVPYAPTLLSPAAADTFAVAAGRNASAIDLTWGIAESPTAQFIAWATWTAPSGEVVATPFSRTGGAQRALAIPAGQIQSGTALLHLEAVNAGSLAGDASADSYFEVSGGPATVGVTSGLPQLLAFVDAGVLPSAYVFRGDGTDMNGRLGTCDALVQATDGAGTSLGVGACAAGDALGTFTFTPPVPVPPGGRVTVTATFDPPFTPGSMEPTAYVSGVNPLVPTILTPAVNATLTAGSAMSAAWESAADPSFFEYEFRWNDSRGVWTGGGGGTVPGTARADATIVVPPDASAALGSWGVEFRLRGVGMTDAASANCSVQCGMRLRGEQGGVPVVVP